ncbi:DUF6460 domain-containing protein [Salinarimonas rosea]|uniref:DUF6460 domain-containing protein n=1 Tax=Salinarimonas rosea TaxID=552063 RepID=UPI0004088A86|nr:DUF6460 domain-containing protein [Salinarimonas rosea]
MQRLLGGSPAAVLVKLVFLSLLVGAFMALLGITPQGLFEGAFELVRDLWETGFEAFGTLGRWLVYGAMVVVPVFVVLRIIAALR